MFNVGVFLDCCQGNSRVRFIETNGTIVDTTVNEVPAQYNERTYTSWDIMNNAIWIWLD